MRVLSALLTVVVALLVCAKLPAQEVRERLAERIQDLNLTDQQEARIADIRNEYRPKVEQAAKDLATVVQEEVGKVRAVLTPDQQQKVQAHREERAERRAEGLAEAIAHLEQLDLTDAEMTKIGDIRKEFRPKIEKAMEGLRGLLTDEQRKARDDALKAGKKRREVLQSLNLTGEQKEKVMTVGKDVATLVREEMEKIREVLTAEQQEKLQDLKEERRDRVRDRLAHTVANLKDLNLTDEQKTKIADIRTEYRPKVHDAGNKLRDVVREELAMIAAVIKQ